MWGFKCLLFFAIANVALSDPSAVDVMQDIYKSCLRDFSVSCVQPKALWWINHVADKRSIKLTDDLVLVKNGNEHEQVNI